MHRGALSKITLVILIDKTRAPPTSDFCSVFFLQSLECKDQGGETCPHSETREDPFTQLLGWFHILPGSELALAPDLEQ